MKRLSRLPLLLLFVWAAFPLSAFAQEQSNPNTYVIIVGVSTFDDAAIKPRPVAENDAKAMYDLFANKDYLATDPANIHLLLGSEDKDRHSQSATKENILKAFHAVAEKASKDDMLIVGLFGQGAPSGERTCYFCVGSTFKDRGKNAVASSEIEHELEKLKSERVVAFVDVNYKSYTPEKGSAIEPNILDMVRVFVGNEDKDEHQLPPGRVIFQASSGVAQLLDTDKHSIFAKAAVDGLKGAADKDGYEPDGLVTVDELQTYLEKEVSDQARQLGKTHDEKEQTPLIWGTRASHFALTKNPAVTPKVEARVEKLAGMDLAKDVKEEGTRMLERMPKLKAQQELRKDYQQLADGTLDAKTFLENRSKILAGMKLDRDDAEYYADIVLRACEQVRATYINELGLGEMIGWSIKGLYRRLEEKLPEEIAKKLEDVKSLNRSKLSDLLVEAREHLGKREDLDGKKDIDLSVQMMMLNLDPYTSYFDKEQVKQMQAQLQGRFTGVGIQIRRDMVRDGLLVLTPIKGSPAYRAGVKAGDLITEIIREVDQDGNKIDPPEVLSTKGMKTDEAVRKILGKAKTKVRLKMVREGADKPIEFEITRGTVDVETVLGVSRKPDDSWNFMIDPKSKIAYIRLTQFAPRSFEDMSDVVKQLQKEGIKGLILDLRFNPGGLLTSAVQISDMFIDDGLIVTIKPRAGVDDEVSYSGKHADSFLDFPMVCMVNGLSASGSEILAACLQDHHRAIILGERSFGKGSVQNMQDFPPTGALIKLTTATFWRPNGKNLNKPSTSGREDDDWGVRPDEGFVVPIGRGERDQLFERLRDQEIIPNRDAPKKEKEAKPEIKDKQLDAALDYLREQVRMMAKLPQKKTDKQE
ncbi:MAG TPA: S41 family peptidase [Gemmataceae bacterium]|jgi:C-terminal peptidase prc|nr:S41 family peptidase [Gemmataceae bacterium]